MFYLILGVVIGGVLGAFAWAFEKAEGKVDRKHFHKTIQEMEKNVNVVIHKVPFCPCKKPAQQKLNHDRKEYYRCNGCVPEFLAQIGESQ